MDIEKTLLPSVGKLILKGETIKAKIFDAELDILDCTFNNDKCVEIDTSKLTHITLTIENLSKLYELIHKAEKKYKILDKKNM